METQLLIHATINPEIMSLLAVQLPKGHKTKTRTIIHPSDTISICISPRTSPWFRGRGSKKVTKYHLLGERLTSLHNSKTQAHTKNRVRDSEPRRGNFVPSLSSPTRLSPARRAEGEKKESRETKRKEEEERGRKFPYFDLTFYLSIFKYI